MAQPRRLSSSSSERRHPTPLRPATERPSPLAPSLVFLLARAPPPQGKEFPILIDALDCLSTYSVSWLG